jgi:hypothetical protein
MRRAIHFDDFWYTLSWGKQKVLAFPEASWGSLPIALSSGELSPTREMGFHCLNAFSISVMIIS